MTDRFFGQANFRFRIVIELESNDWDTQGPTAEEAQQWARERAEKVVKRSARRGFPECDDVIVTEFTCIESEYDISAMNDECVVCSGSGKEAGRVCDACLGRGFHSPAMETTDDMKAPF